MKKISSNHPTLRHGGVKHRFTLIELLVVIAIIAILAAILLPALNSARERGRSANCISNLKQLGSIITMYEEAYGYYPGGRGYPDDRWIMHLRAWDPGFSKQMLVCPSADPAYFDETDSYCWYRIYAMLGHYDMYNPAKMHSSKNLWNPSRSELYGEAVTSNGKSWCGIQSGGQAGSNSLIFRHAKRMNLLFGDMHVNSVTKELEVPAELQAGPQFGYKTLKDKYVNIIEL